MSTEPIAANPGAAKRSEFINLDETVVFQPGRRSVWRVYARSTGAVIGAIGLVFLIVVTMFARWLEPYDPLGSRTDASRVKRAQFETLARHRSIRPRRAFAHRSPARKFRLKSASFAVVISVLWGSLLGLIAGYLEWFLDAAIMRFIDMLLAFPGLLLAMAIVGGARQLDLRT